MKGQTMRQRIGTTCAVIGMLLFGIAAYGAGTHHAFSPVSLAAADDCQTFSQTGKMVCGEFLKYWQDHGGLAQQGYPLSDVFDEKSETDGITHKVQYFERAVFEMHPENQPPNTVLLGLLGSQKYAARYASGAPGTSQPVAPMPPPAVAPTSAPTATIPAPTATTSAVTFLSVQGNVAGGAASAAIKGPPSAQCAITFTTPAGVVSTASGLGPKITTTSGLTVWNWTIDSNTRNGTGTLLVQCTGGVSGTASIRIG